MTLSNRANCASHLVAVHAISIDEAYARLGGVRRASKNELRTSSAPPQPKPKPKPARIKRAPGDDGLFHCDDCDATRLSASALTAHINREHRGDVLGQAALQRQQKSTPVPDGFAPREVPQNEHGQYLCFCGFSASTSRGLPSATIFMG